MVVQVLIHLHLVLLVFLITAEVVNISNVEILSLTTGSTLTVNDAFLAANPGINIKPGATSTIKASTVGDSLSTSECYSKCCW